MSVLIPLWIAAGLINAVIAYDQKILMLANGYDDIDAWAEAVFYVILWPVQVAFWISVKIWQAMDWCQAWIWR